MKPEKSKFLIFVLVLVAVAVMVAAGCTSTGGGQTSAGSNGTVTITDMAGREVTIPDNITSVLCTSPPSTTLIYMIAPDKLGGWNYDLTDEEKEYIPEKYWSLPVCGGWFGKQTGNYENFIQMDPSIVCEGYNTQGNVTDTIDERQQKMGDIPVVGLEETTNAENYTPAIKFAGELLGEQEQAQKLIDFYEDTLNQVESRVSGLNESEKPLVYYAEGPEGLQTDPSGSPHSQLIDLCGGINVADCAITPGYGRTSVSMEQIIDWDPEIILAGDPTFYASIYNDSNWKDITAVKEGKVYMIPTTAFCWFDRPPGVNRIIGIPWTAKTLHPDLFGEFNIREMAQYFHENFVHQKLTDEQMDALGL